jgi:3-dehydroquinate synthase
LIENGLPDPTALLASSFPIVSFYINRMQSILVSLGHRSYPIYIGVPSAERSLEIHLLQSLRAWSKLVLIYDENVEEFAQSVASSLSLHGVVSLLPVPSGEGSKSIDQLGYLWQRMLSLPADRKAVVVAIGGGVVGDLAGFLAATWNRGIRFVQVPTTLLAMVDSSVGGKTGINLPNAKNVVGAFWQPSLVWADLTALNTLPDREFRSGLAEVVKYGVILDPELFDYLEAHVDLLVARNPDAVTHIVRRSCELKAHVVGEDEFETTGLRAILNYGHTFGHAIEALTSYGQFLHGEAISIGMTMAGRLSVSLGRWPQASFERQTQLLTRLGLPTDLAVTPKHGITVDRMLDAMQLDKKTEHGQINLILPTRIGHVETVRGVATKLLRESMDSFFKTS